MRKSVCISTILCLICFLFLPFFASCGETKTISDVSRIYNSVLSEYKGVFFNEQKQVSITYAAEVSNKIETAETDSLFYGLKNDETLPGAVFEPVLKAEVFVVNYFIDWELENYKKVPKDKMNSLYVNAQNIESGLIQLKRAKNNLENSTNLDGYWIEAYRREFYETLKNVNAFSVLYIEIFDKYVNEDNTLEGDVSVSRVRLEYAKKLVDTANYMVLCLKDYINDVSYQQNASSKFCDMFSIYKQARQVFESDEFQQIIPDESVEQQNIVSALDKIKKYDSLYQNEYQKTVSVLEKYLIKDLKEKEILNTLSDEEKTSYNKFKNFDFVFKTMFLYLSDLKTSLEEWQEA